MYRIDLFLDLHDNRLENNKVLQQWPMFLRHALQRSYGLVTRLTGPGEATIELSEGSSHIQRAEVARRRLGAVMLPPLLVVAW